jgi:alanyl-tRNA synthetase
LPFEISRDIAREHGLDVDEEGFKAAREQHSRASGGGKAMGKLGGEDAEFFAGILKDLQKHKKLGEHGVEYDPYTSPRVEGEVLAMIVNGQAVKSASFGDPVEIILPRTGFYIESGGQVDDTGYIRSLAPSRASEGEAGGWEIEVTAMRRASAGVIVHIGEVIAGQPKVGDLAIAEVDMQRRHDIMRNHTATHLMHAALHQVLGEHARQAGSLVAPDRLRFDFNHPEAMTPEQIERVERIVNDAIASDMEVIPKLKSREDAISEGAMALFGEKYGETVRTITIAPLSSMGMLEETETIAHPSAVMEKLPKYSYELCGGTHLERTSDVGAFLIVSEGSAAAGVRRIEAVTGRGAYDLIAHRFKLLKQTAAALKSSIEEAPFKVESLQDEVADLKKEVASLRASQALSTFNQQLSNVQTMNGIHVMALEVPNSNVDALRTLADKFREKYPQGGIAVLTSGGSIISVVTEDLVKRGLKAGDLIVSIGGRGGGRPNLAQGSLPDPSLMKDAMSKVQQMVEGKLK